MKHNIYIITIIHLNFEIMKKKLMMVAVLLGALSLGACVDNDESASVEAVRNAKAEQLKGLAALANAQAEATKITAEAEAALKNAQAEYQKEMTEEAKQKFAARYCRSKIASCPRSAGIIGSCRQTIERTL